MGDGCRRGRAALGLAAALLLGCSPGPAPCVVLAGQSNAGAAHADALRERGLCVIDAHVGASCLACGQRGWKPGNPHYRRMTGLASDQPVRAVIWVQGESDGNDAAAASAYPAALEALVEGIRSDLGAPTIVTLLPTTTPPRPGARPYWHHVRRAQLDLIRSHPDAHLGADPDTLFYTTGDGVHYDDDTLRRIARDEQEALQSLR